MLPFFLYLCTDSFEIQVPFFSESTTVRDEQQQPQTANEALTVTK